MRMRWNGVNWKFLSTFVAGTRIKRWRFYSYLEWIDEEMGDFGMSGVAAGQLQR